MNRRTKIVATLGPATDDAEALERLIRAGCDVVRINFSHGDAKTHGRRIRMVRAVARELDTDVAVLADLSGPKIRIDRFREGRVELQAGDDFTLYARENPPAGDASGVGVAYLGLAGDVRPGSELLLDDGLMALEVKEVVGDEIRCTVLTSGPLSDRKGLNLRGGGLSIPGVSEADKADILLAAEWQVDFLAVSFPRGPEDMEQARALLHAAGGTAGLVSKIERTEAIENLDAIIEASDAVLVARGDLGVEIGEAELPGLQKRIIAASLRLNRPVITATQMMQSMIDNPIPTRAEVLDVANAVIDGTDAVMLSAETAVGKHPSKVIEAMGRICEGAERHVQSHVPARLFQTRPERADQAIAMAAMMTANNFEVQAIIALTESGSTAQWLSRVRSPVPIAGLSPNRASLRKMRLYQHVQPLFFAPGEAPRDEVPGLAIERVKAAGLVRSGDRVLMTLGDAMGELGTTNTLKILRVP
ncbi:pyruvate kinase [Wenzhouxiangella marina]|uniref:Pyruvate kinase n=1 Tax=Wenzhouxiangella marina TaxID=1579979 RepID=A0A0K0XZD3_9GAMM|nr:pyruvate kinase [Wenzhouxiangella marina]AKS42981.1 Pyruvate kinase [Wenzhouxiangella marina]MBB6087335.1 pyruvate kinase [Wenzhouxiangella marina]